MSGILADGAEFVSKRLAAANLGNDGQQSPFKGHPVFIADKYGSTSPWRHRR
jgi:hypothetical protein